MGFFNVKLTAKNSIHGCSDSFSRSVHVNNDCNLTDVTPLQSSGFSGIYFYPNPATSTLTIESESTLVQSIHIYDITGREVYRQENLKTQNESIPVGNFPAGV